MFKLRVNDKVIVIAGKDKGKTGIIKKVLRKRDRVLVEGVNMAKKATKRSQENPNGGVYDVELPLHISNVSILDPKENKATRVRIVKDGDRNKRVTVLSGTELK